MLKPLNLPLMHFCTAFGVVHALTGSATPEGEPGSAASG
jgi:uncharacterized membrane protein